MPTPINDTIKEAQAAGAVIRQAGPIITLSIAVIVLGVALTFSMATARIGADRWTRSDHIDYVQSHGEEVDQLVDQLLTEHQKVHDKENGKQEQIARDVVTVRQDVAVLKSTVSRMEEDIKVIKSAVMRIEREGSR